jgi:hypothetical protein
MVIYEWGTGADGGTEDGFWEEDMGFFENQRRSASLVRIRNSVVRRHESFGEVLLTINAQSRSFSDGDYCGWLL